MKKRIFISSVQKEFQKERLELAAYFRNDPLLSEFFNVFIFEEVPALSLSPEKVYPNEVETSDIYLGLLGIDYGHEDENGISPTEHEYDIAKASHLQRWIFIKNTEEDRHKKEQAFIRKIEQDVSRKSFDSFESLQLAVYHSCILYLKQNGFISTSDFDNSMHPEANLQDIDTDGLKEFVLHARAKRNFPLKESSSVDKILTHLNLFRNNKLVNSALLAFSTNPQKYFPSAIVKCAHFHGFKVIKPIPDFKEFHGNVWHQAIEAIDFILSKVSVSTGSREESNSVDTVYEVPRKAIAEAVINAIAHRDYNSKGSVQVSVFKDRIEISNPGYLPPELSLQDLKKDHTSFPRNELLANCLFLTGDIERFGTGTLDIIESTEARGLLEPLFEENEGFKVIIWRPSAVYTRQDAGQDTGQDTGQDAGHDTIHDDTKNPKYIILEELEMRILWVIEGEMSRDDLMEKLELSGRDNFVKNYLNPAQENKWIEMTLPDKPTSKNQKYRLTRKGKKLKKEIKS